MAAAIELPANPGDARWPHRLAVAAAAVALLPTAWGAMVTGLRHGMAVPDAPTTFGQPLFLYPLSDMAGGVAVEHPHRLFGALAGLFTLVLSVSVMLLDRRLGVRRLAGAALALVVLQGLLGQLRVGLNEKVLAAVHGAVAPAFFAALAALAAALNPGWPAAARVAAPAGIQIRGLAAAVAGVLYLQILLGVVLRHFGWGLPYHLTGAALAFFAAWTLTGEVLGRWPGIPALAGPARSVRFLLLLQLGLGLASWAVVDPARGADPLIYASIAAGHVLVGAGLLGSATGLAMWVHRIVPAADSAVVAVPAGEAVR